MPEEKTKANLYPVEKRSDSRLRVSVPIEVVKTDAEGHQVTERSFIEDVSDFGCRFSISCAIAKGDILTVEVLELSRKPQSHEPPRQFEVMWVQRQSKNSAVGARIVSGQKMDKVKLAEGNPPLSESTQRRDP
jgi:PilZ domain